MTLMIVVPGETLGEMEVLPLDGIGRMEEDVEAPVLETVVEFLDLPVVLGMVGFVPYVGNACSSTGCRESCSPLPSAVCPDGTDEEGGMGNDVVEEGDRTILITAFVELRESEP